MPKTLVLRFRPDKIQVIGNFSFLQGVELGGLPIFNIHPISLADSWPCEHHDELTVTR